MKLLSSLAFGFLGCCLAMQISAEQAAPQQSGIVHTPETDIAYEQFGHDTGHTPAIIINGGPGLSHTYLYWTDVFTKKFSRDRSVTFYDQRGLGSSRLHNASASQGMDAQIADLEALRAHLGYARIDLIGHSLGGLLAMAYAAAFPQHIQHLVLIDSAAPQLEKTLYLFAQVYPDQLAQERKNKDGNDPATSFRRYLSRCFYSQERFQELVGKLSDKDLGRIVNDNINQTAWNELKSYDATGSLKKFDFPTLVMWGRFDINAAVLTGWKISQAIPGAQWAVYSKSGHFPFYEQESEFLQDLNSFLGK